MISRTYYFEISQSGGAYYAQARLPSKSGPNTILNAALALGDNPEKAASAILNHLQTAGALSSLNIYTKFFHTSLSKGGSVTRQPIHRAELEKIVELVGAQKPDLTISSRPV